MKSRLCRTYAVLLASCLCSVLCNAQDKRPNVVFILADDLGYGDVQSYGGDRCRVATPNFDRLASEGVRFTDAYANASVCVPTRTAIMTGTYPWRLPAGKPGGPWGFLGPRLSKSQHTIGRLLRDAGYRTSYVGKWHLGTEMATKGGKPQGIENVDYSKPLLQGPTDHGFQDSFILPGSLDMYPYAFVRNGSWIGSLTARKGWSAFNRVGPAAEHFEDHQVLGRFCDEAEELIAKHAEQAKPFFLYLALTSPHTPTCPSEKFRGSSPIGIYGDFVQETDHCVGRILDALDRHELSKNTLVIATSDHGPAAYAGRKPKATYGQLERLQAEGHDSNGPFRGYKFSVYEGGLRVPFVARWPGTVPSGAESSGLVALPDLMATLAEIAKVKLQDDQALDSFSIVDLLRDPSAKSNRPHVILEGTHGMAIRRGTDKLCLCPGSGTHGRFGNRPRTHDAWSNALAEYGQTPKTVDELLQFPFVQLFDVHSDVGEETNLAREKRDLVVELHSTMQDVVDRGRSRPGPPMDGRKAKLIRAPQFVWKQPSPPDPLIQITESEGSITATYDGQVVLKYHKAIQMPPNGIAKVFRRSGYIHPICSPSGAIVSGDFAPDHAHQHAVFQAWTKATFEGHRVDFWNQKKEQGNISHAKVLVVGADTFEVEIHHHDTKVPKKPKLVLKETWTVRLVGKTKSAFMVDLTSKQTCVADSPLTINEYHYGGMALRGSNQWYTENGVKALAEYQKAKSQNGDGDFPSLETTRHRFSTSDGKDRFEGNHSRPEWVDLSGYIDNRMVGVSVISHPSNFRHPQPVRLHPNKPYFCFAPMVLGEFSIQPGDTYVSRYRYLIHDGDHDPQEIRRQRDSFRLIR